jgi:hypothetical protein
MSEPENKIKEVRVLFEDGSCQVGANFDFSSEEKINALKAEVIRFRLTTEGMERELKEWHRMFHDQVNQVKALEAENERLRKAGDGIPPALGALPNNFTNNPQPAPTSAPMDT